MLPKRLTILFVNRSLIRIQAPWTSALCHQFLLNYPLLADFIRWRASHDIFDKGD